MNSNWVIDRIQDISFYNTNNCNKYDKIIQKELEKSDSSLSNKDRSIYELFALKIKYYKQSLNEEDEKYLRKIIDFCKENGHLNFAYIGILFLCRLYLNTKRINLV